MKYKKSRLSKSIKLRDMLNSNKLEFAMEAHSGLSAVIAEEAGFKCLWASGLSMSAMTGCRDRNELDISEVSKIVEWMADHTTVPILVDGDTGGVDYRSAQIMVDKLSKAGAAGVCIEDKLYPKSNSLLDGTSSSDLADVTLHCGKIKAMKSENPEFVVVARLEEFISGLGVQEAYRRALAYQDAGADAILVHSKIKNDSQIREFMEYWNSDKKKGFKRVPIVIVPTKYFQTPTDNFREYGVSLVIWANHNIRASIEAMQKVSKDIYERESLVGAEKMIVPVSEIFRLQHDEDMKEFDKKYSPVYGGTSLILSGTDSKNVKGVPKVLEEVDHRTILDRQVSVYKNFGIKRIAVVSGQDSDKFDCSEVRDLDVDVYCNNNWENETEVGSTLTGLLRLTSDCNLKLPLIISYGDLVFKDSVVSQMIAADADIVIGVDPNPQVKRYNEFVTGDRKFERLDQSNVFNVKEVVDKETSDSTGSFIGMICINSYKGLSQILDICKEVDSRDRMCKVLNQLTCKVKGVYVTSNEWVDINDMSDVNLAEGL